MNSAVAALDLRQRANGLPVPEDLRRVHPVQVFLVACDPDVDRVDHFLPRLAALMRFAIVSRQGQVEWDALEGAMAHDRTALLAGLRWLEARGQITLRADEPTQVLVAPGGGVNPKAEADAMVRLRNELEESSAYRRFFRTADATRLVRGG